MSGMRLSMLRASLFQLGRKPWRWQPVERPFTTMWTLEQEDERVPSGLYAVGEHLSPLARAVAILHPGTLNELAEVATLDAEALERLTRVRLDLERLQKHAYQSRNHADYPLLRAALTELNKAVVLLQRSQWFDDQAQFTAWEDSSAPIPADEGSPPD